MAGSIDFLNVGFGEATVIRLENDGRNYCYVVDAGDVEAVGKPRRCSLRQYVQEYNIAEIDGLILTHFHRDHIGGALAVLGKVAIREIILHVPLPERILSAELNDDATPVRASLSLYAELIVKATELAIPIQVIQGPCSIRTGGLAINLMTPDVQRWRLLQDELSALDPACLEQEEERLMRIDRLLNETALAAIVSLNGKKAALLTSDVGPEFWTCYEEELGNIHLVQAPHHGDVRGITRELLRTWSPEAIIVSADDEGTWGLPHPELEKMVCEHSEAKLYYTEGKATEHRIIALDMKNWTLNWIP